MHYLLTALGSAGDVHPMVGIGARLRAAGHRVTLFTSPLFAELVERLGLEMVELGTREEFEAVMHHPDVWHPTRGMRTIIGEAVVPHIRPLYEALAARVVAGETVVVAHPLDLAAPTLCEKHNVPLASIYLAPAVLRSLTAPPHLPPMLTAPWVPRWMIRAQYRVADVVIDRMVAPEIDALRRDLGLPRVRRFFHPDRHAPDRVIGMFPDWFGPPQADWPPHTVLAGFPLWDESDLAPLAADVAQFLDAGSPPIVFAPGSANVQGAEFFAIAVDACRRLGRRGALLTKYPEQLPRDLPDDVRHFAYVPFSQLLPRAAALVHHGGIGTSAQGLAAGIPHLVMPMAFDQPDNARRLIGLGVADALPPGRFRGPAVSEALKRLLDSPRVAQQCNRFAACIDGHDAIGTACEALEQFGRRTER